MRKSKSAKENKKLKILWNFKVQTNYPIQARIQGLLLINEKRTCYLVDFFVP